MKKLCMALMCLLMLLTASALADVSTDGQWEYRVDYYGRAQLTDWRWESLSEIPDVVEVPAEIDGHKVTSIWQGTFTTTPKASLCEGGGASAPVGVLVLPDSIIDIYGGFEDCGASRIVLNGNMYTVHEGSFAGCTAEVELAADSQRVVQRDGFLLGVSEWNEEFARLLYVNPSAKGAELPELTQIGHHALDNWLTGEAITLPETVERIGLHEAYIPCANPGVIRTVEQDGQIWEYREDGGEAVLTGWLTMYGDVPAVLTLPDELDGWPLTTLADNVFNTSESSLENRFTLVIPEGVRDIEGDPFRCCHDVTRIEFPSTFVGDLEGCFHHVYAEFAVAPGNSRYEVCEGWLIDKKTDTLIAMSPTAKFAEIPAVRRIGPWALSNWHYTEGIFEQVSETGVGVTLVLPEGVEELADYCLYENIAVTDIVFPSTLTDVGEYAFYGTWLEEEPPEIPMGITRHGGDAGEWAFTVNEDGTATLTAWEWCLLLEIPETLEIPAFVGDAEYPVTAIADEALMSEDVSTIIIPEGVTRFEGDPFVCCHGAERIVLPASLTQLGQGEGTLGIFHHVSAEIEVAQGNPRYEMRGGYLIDRQTDTLIYAAPSANLTELPAVKRYAAGSLANWGWIDPWPETGEGLTMVIPEGVESLDTRTLYDNVCISKVVLPDSMKELSPRAFESCAITEIVFGNGLMRIPSDAFCAMYDLESVTLPESVAFVGFCAFDEGTQVTALNPVCRFETEAEYYAKTAETHYTGEHGEWGYATDGWVATLTDWRWENLPEIPDVVAVPAEIDGYPVTRIHGYAFAMEDMPGVKPFELVIPEGVETVAVEAINWCLHASAIHLPTSLTAIEGANFDFLMADVVVVAGNPRYENVGGYLIDRETQTLLYASRSVADAPIPAVRAINTLCNWGMACYPDGEWPESGEGLTLIIPEGVERLGRYLIHDSLHISNLVLPDSLRELAPFAFHCTALTEVQFGTGLTYIPEGCFSACELTAVTLPESVTFVGYGAFSEGVEVTALNPDCRFETYEECVQRLGDDIWWW